MFVPSAATHTAGVNWSTDHPAGRSLAIDRFFIAKPTDTAARINRALAAGKNLLLTPGVYELEAPIRVTRPHAVVLGLGYATLMPIRGTAALLISDVPGVVASGLVVDAGTIPSANLVRVGRPGQHKDRSDAHDPTTLTDLFVRAGGATAGVANTAVTINSDHVLIDDSWIWRADHGAGGGWSTSSVDHGLIVNGDNATATGLFVEHWQGQQVIWNGQGGQTVFYQSEMPEGMPNQAAWMNGSTEAMRRTPSARRRAYPPRDRPRDLLALHRRAGAHGAALTSADPRGDRHPGPCAAHGGLPLHGHRSDQRRRRHPARHQRHRERRRRHPAERGERLPRRHPASGLGRLTVGQEGEPPVVPAGGSAASAVRRTSAT